MMSVTLDDVKLFLRLEDDYEDSLLEQLVHATEAMVENILRHELSSYDTIPADILQAILYGVAYLYENRETADFKSLTTLLRAVLYPYRTEAF